MSTKIKKFVFNPFQENTYIVYDENKECVIIDPGCDNENEFNQLYQFIEDESLKPIMILNTHGHVDHIMGNKNVFEKYNVEIAGNEKDNFLVESAMVHAASFGFSIEEPPKFTKQLNEGENISFGKTDIELFHVPGHSPGSICFYIKSINALISGDVLFAGSIGRTDLPGGNYDVLIEGIKSKLFTLPEDTTVLPGHGQETTIGFEMKENPFIR